MIGMLFEHFEERKIEQVIRRGLFTGQYFNGSGGSNAERRIDFGTGKR
jgi:hypothetical protein